MADLADLANQEVEALINEAISHRQVVKTIGPEECDECGEKMPEIRRNLGLRLCIDCAQIEEMRTRR